MKQLKIFLGVVIGLVVGGFLLRADDVDIYQATVKQNAVILVDTSGSMSWGVYEWTEDYGNFYDYLIDVGDAYDNITGNGFYHNHEERNRVFLVSGNIGWVPVEGACGQTGDPGDPTYLWNIGDLYKTNKSLDENGDLVDAGTGSVNLSVDSEGHILLNGKRLPHCQDIELHNILTNPDGSQVDLGFAGMMRAPGVYFSGYFKRKNCSGLCLTDDPNQAEVEDGHRVTYFFITGNWINMQQFYNLEIVTNSPQSCESGHKWDPAWKWCWDGSAANWQEVSISPRESPHNYYNNMDQWYSTIHQPGALEMMVHFSTLKLYDGWWVWWGWCGDDYVDLWYSYGGNNPQRKRLTYSNNGSDMWVGPFNADTINVHFTSDSCGTNWGFLIDKIRYVANSGGTVDYYRMKSRLDISKEAIINVVKETYNKVNWGIMAFNSCDGARKVSDLGTPLNQLISEVDSLTAGGGTPLGEATQDVWNYYENNKDKLVQCAGNYVIILTDGNPSCDDDWGRIPGVHFRDWDGDGWTEDPYQYRNPPPDYWDDVAHYMATHDLDPTKSGLQNITTFVIGLNLDAPLARDTAEDGGGLYTVAYNRQQIINAFYAFGLVIAETTSYTAPVVSVNPQNKTQSGNYVYVSLFRPNSGKPWSGNVKKYRISYDSNGQLMLFDKNGNPAIYTTGANQGEFIPATVSYWSDEQDGGEIEKGGAGEVLEKAIQKVNISVNPYSFRDIYWFNSDGETEIFDPYHISNSDLSVDTDALRYDIVNMVYGYTPAHVGTGTHPEYPVSKRSWILGDIIHSRPAVVYYKSTGKTYIIVGANDGLLHVFDDSDGKEVAAFIMPDDMNKFKELALHPASHEYFVDAPIIYYTTSNGEKRLIFGKRRGGYVYYIMDINDPDPANWKIVNTISDSEIGLTFSTPVVWKAKFKNGKRTYIFFGGGYDPAFDGADPPAGSVGRGIFIVDGDTGEIVAKYTYDDNSNLTFPFAAKLGVYDLDGNYSPETIYAGDLGGRLWRFNISFDDNGGITDIEGKMIFRVTSDPAGVPHRIFYAPQLSLGSCWSNQSGPVVYFGTGDRANIKRDDLKNRVYAVIDDNPDTPYTDADLINVTDNTNNLTSDSTGWYIDLTKSGEKMVSPLFLFNKVLYFSTFVPSNDDPCNPHGDSYAYAISYCQGQGVFGNNRILNENNPGNAPASGLTLVIKNGVASVIGQIGNRMVMPKVNQINTIRPLFWRYLP